MMNEVQNKFADLGFKVDPVVDPETGYFTFDIIGRISNHEFDYEKKGWEVRKAKETGDTVNELKEI